MIDLVLYVILLAAVVQGWRKGLILALFSLVCGLIGLAAAVKLSAVVASHLQADLHMKSKWLPVISFALVFILVLLIIRWTARLLEKLLKLVLLEWLNKVGGILFYSLLYLSIYSIVLFYGTRMQVISKQTLEDSHFYSLIAPFGPAVIRFISSFIPFGQDMFTALEGFFDKIARNLQ